MNAPDTLAALQADAERYERGDAAADADLMPPEGSHDAVADYMAEHYRDQLRYCATLGGWLVYEGGVWRRDETLRGFDIARACCREFALKGNESHRRLALASGPAVAAVEKMAKADRRMASTVDQWDADPWLLNTPGGVVDLRTGALRPGRPDDYCTSIAAATPAPPGTAPDLWLQVLTRVTNGEAELVDYLQRVAGYCLTGATSEHALFFKYGTGANGKSVVVNTLSRILGSYARTAPIEVFMASQGDRHPTELAMLRGARLVTAVETEEGRRWAEAKIKALTGGDTIAARFMRADFFEFRPAFKLLVAGNHKPGLRGVDEAIRRRLHLIPFSVKIPEAERDPNLPEKLQKEWPAILRWMIDGCLAWQRQRLDPPAIVRAATDDYMAAEDAFGLWVGECCEESPASWESASALYASFKAWATAAGEFVPSQKRFGQVLEDRGYRSDRRRDGRGYLGLKVLQKDMSDAYWNR